MRRAVLIACLCGTACGPIDPEPPTDEDDNEIVVPGGFDTYLGAQAEYPAEVGVRPILRLVFDAFVDEDELLDFSVMSLQSGGINAGGRVTWQMSTRTLSFRPFSDLVVGLRYRPTLDASHLFSVTGAPLGAVDLPEFRVVDEPAEDSVVSRSVRWPEIDGLFEAKCRSCHSDPQWQLNPLTRESLVGQRSAQLREELVVPFDPGDSYLMHKIIDDYPIRRFTVQPPPWSDAQALTDEEIALVEHWILTGARE